MNTLKKQKVLTLESFIPYRLSLISNTVSSGVAETYRDKYGLSITEWRIMAILGEYPGASAEEVCRRTRIEKSLVSRALTRLLRRVMVGRVVDEQDKRRSHLTLSVWGAEVYGELVPLSISYEKSLLQCFNADERKLFSQLLERLQVHAQAL